MSTCNCTGYSCERCRNLRTGTHSFTPATITVEDLRRIIREEIDRVERQRSA